MVSMIIRVIELGPFGCHIDRGSMKELENLPEGYEAKRVEAGAGTITIYIEPTGREKLEVHDS